eukprot:g2118.t1
MSAVENLVAISGLDTAEAESYLEMAGGNLDAAVELWMSLIDTGSADSGGGGGGSGGDAAAVAAALGDGESYPDWWTLVWGAHEPVPAAWIDQGLDFGG